jgi:hypothetical protein
VQHKCGWGCKGTFYPSRYNSSRAKCIRCYYCDLFYSPNKFIFHAHQTPDAKYVQPDTANFNSWRRHLTLLNPNRDDDIANAWEDVKAIFNGGTRKRMISFPDRNNKKCFSRSSSIDSDQVKGSNTSDDNNGNKHLSPIPFQNSDASKIVTKNSKLFTPQNFVQSEFKFHKQVSHALKRKESVVNSDDDDDDDMQPQKRKEKFSNFEHEPKNIETKPKSYLEFIEHPRSSQVPNSFQQSSTNEVNFQDFLPNNFYISNIQAYSKLAAFTATSSNSNKIWPNKSLIDDKLFAVPPTIAPLNGLSNLIPHYFNVTPTQPATSAEAPSSLGRFYSQVHNLIDYWKNDERFYLAQLEKLHTSQYPMSAHSAANSNNLLQMGLPKEFLISRNIPLHQNRFSSIVQASTNLQKSRQNTQKSLKKF